MIMIGDWVYSNQKPIMIMEMGGRAGTEAWLGLGQRDIG
jgi:hypothetical protein